MKIIKIQWKNMGSFGNRLQELDFNQFPGFYMLTGNNGTGKSTILQTLSFALYGKIPKKTISDIVNRKNGNAWCKIELISNSKHIIIERGASPGVLNLWVNNVKYEEAGKKNIQSYIEDELLQMPSYVFENTISLDINTFKSFTNMSPADKRSIIDRLFSLDIINEMKKVSSKDLKSFKDSLDKIDSQIHWISQNIESTKNKIEEIKSKKKVEFENNILDLQNQLVELEPEKTTLQQLKENIDSKNKWVSTNESAIQSNIIKLTSTINSIKEKIRLYNNNECPTCEGPLNTPLHNDKKTALNETLNAAELELQAFNDKKILVQDRKKVIRELESKYLLQAQSLKTKISNINNEIESSKRILKSNTELEKNESAITELSNIIVEHNDTISKTKSERSELSIQVAYMDIVDTMLSDSGVKTYAIKKIVPLLNSYIQQISKEMGTEYTISFDTEFNCNITHVGIPIKPSSLSTGESKKIDTVIAIAILRMIKIKYSNLNILFLDEIFSSLDPESVFHVIRTLKDLSTKLRINTIVINHSPLPHEEFDYIITTQKHNGFSDIKIDQVV